MPANRQIVADAYAAFARGDAPAVLGLFAPDITWNEAEHFIYADRNPYIGPGAVAEGVFMRLLSEFEDFAVHPASIYEDGNTVIAVGRYSGTYRASGQPVNAQFAHVWTLQDGSIVAFQQYTDTLQFARAARLEAAIPA